MASLFITITIVVRHQPVQPREMVLIHPSGELVPAGVTPEDLEEAIRLSKEYAAELITMDPESEGKKMGEMGQLLLTGQIVELKNNTPRLLLETKGQIRRVQLTEGLQNGNIY